MRRFAACPWLVAHTPSGAVIELCVATGFRRRLLGLAGLRSLGAGRGLAIPRCNSVHTIGMRFAIDVVFVEWALSEARATVLDVHERVTPLRLARTRGLASRRSAVCAVELRGGQSLPLGLVPGAELRLDRRATPGPAAPRPASFRSA